MQFLVYMSFNVFVFVLYFIKLNLVTEEVHQNTSIYSRRQVGLVDIDNVITNNPLIF